jgi:hypothetical protein
MVKAKRYDYGDENIERNEREFWDNEKGDKDKKKKGKKNEDKIGDTIW